MKSVKKIMNRKIPNVKAVYMAGNYHTSLNNLMFEIRHTNSVYLPFGNIFSQIKLDMR